MEEYYSFMYCIQFAPLDMELRTLFYLFAIDFNNLHNFSKIRMNISYIRYNSI